MLKQPLIIAVDFDGTLCDDEYPEIGKAHTVLIEQLKNCKKDGNKLILWTCREGEHLENALNFCYKHGLSFDAINDNLQENIKKYHGKYTRKIYANIYLDDHSMLPDTFTSTH